MVYFLSNFLCGPSVQPVGRRGLFEFFVYFQSCSLIFNPAFTRTAKIRSDCTKSDGKIEIFLSLHLIMCNRIRFWLFV